jgi:predicted nucleic acid-binding protein
MRLWLIDKSALVRLASARDASAWAERLERGLIRVAAVTLLEVGYSARSGQELRRGRGQPPLSVMPVEYLTPSIEDRAMEVQELLANQGRHRAPSVADLLVAATAELVGLAVLHLDKDFELIAEVTGQPLQHLETSSSR